jgi:hypothetical protein
MGVHIAEMFCDPLVLDFVKSDPNRTAVGSYANIECEPGHFLSNGRDEQKIKCIQTYTEDRDVHPAWNYEPGGCHSE